MLKIIAGLSAEDNYRARRLLEIHERITTLF